MWANGYVGHLKVNRTDSRQGSKIGRLITAGPYAHVRHPLYVGTFLIGLGVCVTVQSVWAAVGALAFFVLLYGRKMREEETLIRDEWGAAYTAYQRAVPQWWPSLRPYAARDRALRWTWQGIWASKELKTLCWVFICFIALYFREESWHDQHLFSPEHWVKHAILLAVAVGLMMIDGLSELQKLAKRRGSLNSA